MASSAHNTSILKSAKSFHKILFDENGEPIKNKKVAQQQQPKLAGQQNVVVDMHQTNASKTSNENKKWFEMFPEHGDQCDDYDDLKNSERTRLYKNCEMAFEEEKRILEKRKTGHSHWLHTALRKGTLHDRANAGALLITSNPLMHLETLSTLIDFTRPTQKLNNDVVMTITDLWIEVLLPPKRKLYNLEFRGRFWKDMNNNNTCPNKALQRQIFAYWYFENLLKNKYFEFLSNMQKILQKSQCADKMICIVAVTKLLDNAPELEGMELTMIINKLGDPSANVANKALYHLSNLATKHSNMCGIIVGECEKLIFRNNISARAQRFGFCYLMIIGKVCHISVCNKLIHICFAFFKKLVDNGEVNSRTMQSILCCLRNSVGRINKKKRENEGIQNIEESNILDEETETTIYRLAHLADIHVSIQTFGLLLELINKEDNTTNNRFYNALYKKLLEFDLYFVGVKTADLFLKIMYKAMYYDKCLKRVKAFIKRLLQMTFYSSSNITAGIMILFNQLLIARKDLKIIFTPIISKLKKSAKSSQQKSNDGDTVNATKINENTETSTKLGAYNAFHRVPMYAGAENIQFNELMLIKKHLHPSVKIFANNIIERKTSDYYGEPLQNFGLPHFLERFSFKNPKKQQPTKDNAKNINLWQKNNKPTGSNKLPVKLLQESNCSADDKFIYNYMEQNRNKLVNKGLQKKVDEKEPTSSDIEDKKDINVVKYNEVNDDEFEDYLNGCFSNSNLSEDLQDLDFGKEMESNKEIFGNTTNKNLLDTNNWSGNEDDEGDIWNTGRESDQLDEEEDLSDEENGNELSSELAEKESDEDVDSLDEETSSYVLQSASERENLLDTSIPFKRRRKRYARNNELSFSKKLKTTHDVSELFATVDDFSEMLEDTGKDKLSGTSNAISNPDKSSKKQLKWEEKRLSNLPNKYKKNKKH